jgi:hypothetical protein
MSVSYPITLPAAPGIRQITWRQRSVVAVGASPFTGEQQVYRHDGQWWECDIVYPAVRDRAIAETLLAALISLNGPEGTFYLGDSVGKLPRGSITGSLQVRSGAAKGIEVLPVQGATGFLALGDWIQISTHLYKVIGVGADYYDVWPRVRQAYSAGTAITYTNAKGVFRLASGHEWSINEIKSYGLQLTAREVL